MPPPSADPEQFADDPRIPLADRELRLPALVGLVAVPTPDQGG